MQIIVDLSIIKRVNYFQKTSITGRLLFHKHFSKHSVFTDSALRCSMIPKSKSTILRKDSTAVVKFVRRFLQASLQEMSVLRKFGSWTKPFDNISLKISYTLQQN